MRFLIILGLGAFLAISLAAAWPADQSGNNNSKTSDPSYSNNNGTEGENDSEGSDEDPVISPKPRWPRWGGIGPVGLFPRPTRLGTL